MITSYKTLSIGKWVEITSILREEMEDIDKQVKVVAILDDKTEDEVLNMPIPDFTTAGYQMRFLYDAPSPKGRLPKVIRLGDWELLPTAGVNAMTTAQYIDFQAYSADAMRNMVQLLSIFLVPKGCKYNDGYDVVALQQAIADKLSVEEGYKVIAFFLTRLRVSMKAMLIYSAWMARRLPKDKRKEMREKLKEVRGLLSRGGDGLTMLMP